MVEILPETETALVATALGLIGREAPLSLAEREASAGIAPQQDAAALAGLRAAIAAGTDPLGAAFSRIRSPQTRRALGAIYTPPEMVAAMLAGTGSHPIARIVDPGAGSGRFLLAAAGKWPGAALVGVECDPVAALMLRANLAVCGLAQRAQVLVGDYRDILLPPIAGRTLFIGNPPYVRHHGIALEWKDWFAATAREFGLKASRLAGLHLHFFLRTLALARPGDVGCFVTAAEWLEVNYGSALRTLLAGPLGVTAIDVLEAETLPFADAESKTMATAVIAYFEIGTSPVSVMIRSVDSAARLGDLSAGIAVSREKLVAAPRWSQFLRPVRNRPAGWIELGEICRVHRGQVTGANAVWIASPASPEVPTRFLHPAITKARELLAAGETLDDAGKLRHVIDLPADLEQLNSDERLLVQRFLDWARGKGAERSYIAQHRKAWWSVGLREPAPILCTYMARRAPGFVRNLCGAQHINIAHGLYPRESLSSAALAALAGWLRENVSESSGRTYAGGLTKFEPKEMERIVLPRLETLISA